MTAKKPTNPTYQCVGEGPGWAAYARGKVRVISEYAEQLEAPDGSGDYIPQWVVSVSRLGETMATDDDIARVRHDFDMADAEEDNHFSGKARTLFLCVEPSRRVECECKSDEAVVERDDGYRYSVPKDAQQREGR